MQGTNLRGAQLDGVHLNYVTLNDEKYGPALLANVKWGECNLAVVDWKPVKMLGDEYIARRTQTFAGKPKDTTTQLNEYQAAVRANRQLAKVLRDQGLDEYANHFAYRAEMLQRQVFLRQGSFGSYLISYCLYLLVGYGQRPYRILILLVETVIMFALLYYILGVNNSHRLTMNEAFLTSITIFTIIVILSYKAARNYKFLLVWR